MAQRKPLVVDNAGQVGNLPSTDRLARGTVFLPAPDRLDESNATYFYFGWSNVDGVIRIERQARANGARAFAQTPGNDFNVAWDDRAVLSYS